MLKDWRYGLAGVVLVGVLVGIVFFARSKKLHSPGLVHEAHRAKGPADAKVQIIEYSDFQCPACRFAQPILGDLFTEYSGKIRLIYQHFPLESHKWSKLAHQAAECAAEQNHFWQYHDKLYSNQTIWTADGNSPLETFMRYAESEGLNMEAFAHCLTDKRVETRIQEERLTGSDLGVRSTPSFFVNGELVIGAQNLREKIAKALQK